MEAPRCLSTDEWIKKLWYIYTRDYCSAIKRNAFESGLMRWMNLESIIQSEVSQKEKHKYYIQMHIESRKMVLKNLFTGKQWRNRHREWTYVQGRGGEGEMYGKSNMETYIVICKVDSQWEFAVWLRELKSGALWQPRGVGWDGRWEEGFKREGTYVYL